MQRRKLIVIVATLASFLAPGAFAQAKPQDKAAKQAEVKAKAMQALAGLLQGRPQAQGRGRQGSPATPCSPPTA